MNQRYSAAAFCIVCSIWSGAACAQVWSPAKTQIADTDGNLYVTANGAGPASTPSLAIGVSIGGTPVLTSGYGHVSPGGPLATADTVYHIGSVSKQFTAAAILALIEDTSGPLQPGGKSPSGAPIYLDAPLTNFMPEATGWSKTPVTLRNMLNMESGFADYVNPPLPDPLPTTQPVPPSWVLRFVLSMLHSYPSPGGNTGYAYSSTNYFLLANVIERFEQKGDVGNYNYQTYLRSRIFQPAKMTETGFIADSFPGLVVAPPGYDISTSSYAYSSWPKGAGEIATTANDLLKWHAALMGGKVIGTNALIEMLTPVGSGKYGMGWWAYVGGGYGWYWHNGVIPGYNSFDGIFVDLKTLKWVSVALLANNENVPLSNLGTCLAQLAMDPSTTEAGLGSGAKNACLLK